MFTRKLCLSLTLLLTLVGTNSVRAEANSTLNGELTKLATEVQKFLESETQEVIAIGDITGPTELGQRSNSGPGIQSNLMKSLEALKVKIVDKAIYTIKGRYRRIDDPTNKDLILLKLTIDILDKNDDSKLTLTKTIDDTTDIAKTLGATVSLPPRADKSTRNETVKKATDNPSVHIEGTKVFAKKDAEYAVEILVKSNTADVAKPRMPVIKNGQAFVDIKRSEIYEVHVFNHSKNEAAVALTIDGFDQFDFSELRDKDGKPLYKFYIVPKNASQLISGWHINNKELKEFLVTEYGKGASAKGLTPAPGKTGTISVNFRISTQNPADLPDDDGPAGSRSSTNNETGFGATKKADLVEVKRSFGVVRDIITIRYVE